jgi:Ca-activated chloride channel homolog
MSRTLARFSALIVALVVPALSAQAQDRIAPDVLIPQRQIIRPGVVTVQSVGVDVKIVDRVATTSMAITLHNPTGAPREAQLILPVPTGSAIRSFGLDAISAEPNAVLLPKDEASRIYRQIVSKMVDPGLLEFIGTDLIRSSVFPVPAGEEATFRVVYEHVLEAESGRFEYALPRSQSLGASGVEWTIEMEIQTSRPIGLVYSPTHALDEQRVTKKVSHIKVLGANEPGPFRVYFVLAGKGGAGITTILYPDPSVADGQGGYFMLFLDAPEAVDRPKIDREVTVVIDRSGSMRGEKIEQAKAAALQIIEALDDGERFNIVDYSDTIERFSNEAVVKNSETVAAVRDYIISIKAVGGTNIHDALLEAVRPEPSEGMLPIVLFLTDGLPTVGPTSETVIRDAIRKANTHQRRIFTFGVGFDVNAPLLTALAQQSRAAPAFVAPGEDVEVTVGQVFSKLSGPVLALPELRPVTMTLTVGPSPIRELMPQQLPDVFAGEQLIVLGQYTTADDLTLAVVGKSGDSERRFTTQIKPGEASHANSFVARLWAQRKIATLIDAIRQAGADGQLSEDDPKFKELVDEIVALSQQYGILTEYTAFLAIEEAYKKNLANDGMIQYRLGRNAVDVRSGEQGVALETTNSARQKSMIVPQPSMNDSMFFSASPRRAGGGRSVQTIAGVDFEVDDTGVSIAQSVQNVAGRAFYLRTDRWVEADLLDKADEEPDREIAYGTDAYDKFVDELIEADLVALLGLNTDHDLYLTFNNERLLVRKPTK